jgi:hypothetical protein
VERFSQKVKWHERNLLQSSLLIRTIQCRAADGALKKASCGLVGRPNRTDIPIDRPTGPTGCRTIQMCNYSCFRSDVFLVVSSHSSLTLRFLFSRNRRVIARRLGGKRRNATPSSPSTVTREIGSSIGETREQAGSQTTLGSSDNNHGFCDDRLPRSKRGESSQCFNLAKASLHSDRVS